MDAEAEVRREGPLPCTSVVQVKPREMSEKSFVSSRSRINCTQALLHPQIAFIRTPQSLRSAYRKLLPTLHMRLLVIVDIDDRLLPLASRKTTAEHNVNLTVRATLHLRKTPPGHNETEKGSAAPDVATLAADWKMLAREQRQGKQPRGNSRLPPVGLSM